MIRRLLALALLVPSLAWATCPTTDAYSTAVCADSPAHYYRMDASSGTLEFDVAGANNFTYNGGFTLGVTGALTGAGITDKAASFNGSTGYATGAPDTSNPVATNGVGWTLEIWGNYAVAGNFKFLITKDAAPSESWVLGTRGTGDIWFETEQSNCSSTHSDTKIVTAYSTGTYYYMVVSTVGAGTDIAHVKTYSQAVLQNTDTSFTGTSICSGGSASYIGSLKAVSNFANGTVDEVALYSFELSQARITAHYNAATAAPASPRAGWPFEGVKRDPTPLFLWPEKPLLAVNAPGFFIERMNRKYVRNPGQYARP